MKKILLHLSIILSFSLSSNLSNAQCGITFSYWYPFGPCTTDTLQVYVYIQGAGTNYSVLWPETGNTSPWAMLDTGNYVVCVTNNAFCTQCDTFSVNCFGWNGTTGIDEFDSPDFMKVYPNPSIGNFTIEFYQAIINGQIEIFSILGKSVYMEELFNTTSREIDLEDLSEGIYFIRYFDGTKYYGKEIIIKSD